MNELLLFVVCWSIIVVVGQTQSTEDKDVFPGSGPRRRHFQGRDLVRRRRDALQGRYPFIVLIRSSGVQMCGGSIISPAAILTAAHCLAEESLHDLDVVVGVGVVDSPSTRAQKLERLVMHEGYNPFTNDNDIAIAFLDVSLHFNDLIQPICFIRDFTLPVATVAGWGQKSKTGGVSPYPTNTEVPFVPLEKCRKGTKYNPQELTDNMLCAGGELDACFGDGGGPLFVELPAEDLEEYGLIGIVSWGRGCGQVEYPGVYTNVGRYEHWIREHVPFVKQCGEES